MCASRPILVTVASRPQAMLVTWPPGRARLGGRPAAPGGAAPLRDGAARLGPLGAAPHAGTWPRGCAPSRHVPSRHRAMREIRIRRGGQGPCGLLPPAILHVTVRPGRETNRGFSRTAHSPGAGRHPGGYGCDARSDLDGRQAAGAEERARGGCSSGQEGADGGRAAHRDDWDSLETGI